MRLHRNSNGMIYDGINLVQWTICRCLLSVNYWDNWPIKLINVNIMSQLTSRGLDNTSSAFVSDLGAGKHPSPLDISESYSPDLYLKVGFYLIKKYCSCPKLSQFKDRAILWLVPAPIYTCCDVSDDIWVLASTRALLTYQNLILLIFI